MTSISVVMATYNGERFIAEQLASIAEQTRLPDELWVADDGSQDSTLDIVRAFAASAPFAVHVHENQQRLGYGDNFLQAALRTQSRLVAFSDQDDVWMPSKLARVAEAFGDPAVVMCAHQADLIDATGAALGVATQGIEQDCVLPPLSLDPWGLYLGFSITVRRSLLDLIPVAERGPDSHEPHKLAAHDRWVYTLANACGDTALIASPLAKYRQHSSNQFGQQRAQRLRAVTLPLSHIASVGEAYVVIAKHRAQLFERAAAREVEPALRVRLDAGAAVWRELASRSERRAAIYREPDRLKRMAMVADNVRASVYCPPPAGRFALSALLKDSLTVIK
jgi:hypothetical protein